MKRVAFVLASMAIPMMVRSYAVTTVCGIESAEPTQQVVMNPGATGEAVAQKSSVAAIERLAEAVGYGGTLRRVDLAHNHGEVGITIYMPDVCGD